MGVATCYNNSTLAWNAARVKRGRGRDGKPAKTMAAEAGRTERVCDEMGLGAGDELAARRLGSSLRASTLTGRARRPPGPVPHGPVPYASVRDIRKDQGAAHG